VVISRNETETDIDNPPAGLSQGDELVLTGERPQTATGKPHHHTPSIVEEARSLSLGVSIFLLVVGAILTFAVNVTTSGFSINTVGVILMLAGALGVVLSLLFWSSFSPYRRGRTVAGGDTVVEERRIERDLPCTVAAASRSCRGGSGRGRRVGRRRAPRSGRSITPDPGAH
jgi:Domain of unknown function (DUF6458)